MQWALARHARNWTVAELATRVGVSAPTVTAIGSVFSTATVVGVRLFGFEGEKLSGLRRRGEEQVALIPSREYHPRGHDDDGPDF